MIECPNCGQNLKFDIASQQMACAYCDSQFNPYAVEKETDAEKKDVFETTIFSCPQCGGEIFSNDNEVATFCLYCGGSTILSERISEEKRPKYIIPFKKTKEDCKAAFAKKMRGAFFVPKEYKDPQFINSFRGIYMPYWSYHIQHEGALSIMAEKSHRAGDYIITDHYALQGNIKAELEGDAYDASSAFYDDISRALAPFDFVEQMDFTPGFLSGFYGDCADVEMELYLDEANELAKECIIDAVEDHDRFKGLHIKQESIDSVKKALKPIDEKANRTMFPVWFMSYRNQDRIAYMAVNGQTGKVVADMPVDVKKYLWGSLLLAIPLFILLNLFVIFNPKEILSVCAGLLLISGLLFATELSAIYKREYFISDKAMLQKSGRSDEYREQSKVLNGFERFVGGFANLYKYVGILVWVLFFVISIGVEFGGFLKYLLWPVIIIGIILCMGSAMKEIKRLDSTKGYMSAIVSYITMIVAALVAFVAPVQDAWYYGAAILTLVAVALNFVEIIRNYNLLAMRKLPQFEKKGGDDYA